jgi:plasmid stability protein
MGGVIALLVIDDKRGLEHHENMADDDLILKIDAELAERLQARAKAAGLSVEAYAHDILRRDTEQPGLAEREPRWEGPLARPPEDDLDQDSEAYADYLDRICDEAERTGGVPWEQVEARLRNFGQRR